MNSNYFLLIGVEWSLATSVHSEERNYSIFLSLFLPKIKTQAFEHRPKAQGSWWSSLWRVGRHVKGDSVPYAHVYDGVFFWDMAPELSGLF